MEARSLRIRLFKDLTSDSLVNIHALKMKEVEEARRQPSTSFKNTQMCHLQASMEVIEDILESRNDIYKIY